jgi:hypothetical protein
MSRCPACGVDQQAGKKFCRGCGSALTEAAKSTSAAPQATSIGCPACGKSAPADAKFCRSCGSALASVTKPAATPTVAAVDRTTATGAAEPPLQAVEQNPIDSVPQPPIVSKPATSSDYVRAVAAKKESPVEAAPDGSRRRVWVAGGAIAAAVLLLAGGGWYLRDSRGHVLSGPDETILSSRLSLGLPAYVKVNSLHAETAENIGNRSEPAFRTRFHAALAIAADTFTQSSVQDGAVILAPAATKGAIREVDGTAISRLSGANWKTEFSLDNNPIPGYGQLRESFPGSTVIVQGSVEEAAFREEQRRRDETERAAQAQPEQTLAQPQQVQDTRREAARLWTEDGQADRPAAAHETQVKKADVDAQQHREEAEREAERNKVEAEAQQRREEAARVAAAETERRRQAEELASRRVEVPAGTEMNVRLSTKLNSGSVHVEDRFEATTQEDVRIAGRTAVPAGSVMRGIVSSVEPATRTNRTARMTLAFDQLTINGQAYPIRARVTQAIAGEGLKGEATKIAVGAGLGGVIGGLLGGVKGAAAGTLIGSGGSIAATEGKQVELSQGAVLRTRIDAPVQIDVK